MDFTIKQYHQLLDSQQHAGFFFKTFSQYLANQSLISNDQSPIVILRHDVDLLPYHSLRFAKIQAERGIQGSYYFRAVPESWDEAVIKEIADLGHEVGYHYENIDIVGSSLKNADSTLSLSKGTVSEGVDILGTKHEAGSTKLSNYSAPEKLIDLAYEDFLENLEKLRKLVDVKTICMHGSPRSKYDNKAIWDKYDYKELGIIGEPYYDMDFNEFFYLTDTGRRWDGWKSSVRDKVPQQEEWSQKGLVFHSTNDIIRAIEHREVSSERGEESVELKAEQTSVIRHPTSVFPSKIMFTMHPQRWHNKYVPWAKELVLQNAKNVVKRFLVKK